MCRWYLAVALMVGGFDATATAQTTCTPPASTFELLQRGIFERHGCTQSFCHGSGKKDGLDLRADTAYDSLLHHDEDAEESDELKMVDPGDADTSALWLSLAEKTLGRTDDSVTAMPIDALPLSPDELEGVRLWIEAGAPERGIVTRVASLIEACPPPPPDTDRNLPTCNATDRALLLPDLHSEAPRDVRVVLNGSHRIIQFTSSIANSGQGPLVVQPSTQAWQQGQLLDAVQVVTRANGSQCTHPAGVIRFQEEGQRWAYGNLATYELRKNDPYTGEVVVRASKTAYCLLDTDPIRAADNLPHQYEAHCTDTAARMGISVGYKDVYHRFHPGQWLDIDQDPGTLVEPGEYYLVNVANPANLLWETDDSRDDNLGYTKVRVTFADRDAGEPLPTAAVAPTPQPTTAPRRPAHPQHPSQPARPGTVPHAPQHPTVVRPARVPRPVATPRPPKQLDQPGAPQPQRSLKPEHPVRPTRIPRPTRAARPQPTPRVR